ncbi:MULTISPECIES: SDR family oxidoreductase [unclassified Plantibacter]|uniref:SDR family oxidoreductase n=1 Tax=unclassified Plantibacter TaxID=2624265 RepID=UPI0012EEFFD5|nr:MULTISPECIES: SDR family oxidoreductase [unclassified Plantibacter]MBD8101568.1 SDR family oxidoreductase [Plantibacter sp. CFBP 8775]VXB57804.1 SDR family NAD(P)-dependent oxidoreductase [Plantibacter sp. T3]
MSRGVAVVTGGTAGLGRATVRELAKRGWDVAVLARGEDGLEATIAEVEQAGRRALAVPTDVADREAVEQAADRVEAELGPIELWVNCAMVGVFGDFLTTEPADFERAVAVNFFGFVNGTRAALSRMTPRDRGHVIQVGSALAHRGIPLQAAYCGSKFGARGFTESVTAELLHDGSNVKLSTVDMPALNTIQFSWVKSQLPEHPQPVPPIYQPEVGATAIADVADRPRRRTWVGESTVGTILGDRFAGGFLDWFLARTGYSGQLAPDKHDPRMPDNVYTPAPGDHGARGVFSDKAHSWSPQTWAIRHRRAVYATAAGTLAAGVALVAGAAKRR